MNDHLKITVDRAAFAEAAAWTAGAISRNPSSPILAGMHLTATDGRVWLSGFDYDTAHRIVLDAEVHSDGETLVSGRFLSQIAGALKGSSLDLEDDGSRLSIASGRSSYRAATLVASEYPTLPEFPTHIGRLDATVLADLLSTVEHAVAKDAVLSAAMAAYNLVGDAGHLTATTTDRFRLARATAPWADASGSEFAANVPGPALAGATKGLVGSIELGCSGGLFGLRSGSRSVVTRILGDGDKFPRTEPLFNISPLVWVEFETAPVIEALKRVALVTDRDEPVRVTFTDGLISLDSGDGSASEGGEEIDCPTGFGEGEMVLKFKPSFLSDTLGASPDARVRIGLLASNKHTLIEPLGSDSVKFIVMPRGNV